MERNMISPIAAVKKRVCCMLSLTCTKPISAVTINMLIILTVTVILSSTLNIWLDEMYSIRTTDRDIFYAIKSAIYFERQPPLYFVILNLWRNINSSPFFARLFSILCILLTIYVVAKLSQRFFPQISPAWLTTSLTLNPFIIWAAVEIRCYAFVILLSALLLLFFYDGYVSNTTKNRGRWLYVLFSILGLYTQYYVGFLLVANAFALLLLRRWQALRAYILGMSLAGVVFLPMLLLIPNQLPSPLGTHDNCSFIDSIKHIYWSIQNYVLPIQWHSYSFDPVLIAIRDFIVRLGLIITLLLLIRKNRSLLRPFNIAIMVIVTILSLLFIATHHTFGPDAVLQRHIAILFLFSILLTFSVITVLNRKIFISYFIVIIFFYTTSLYAIYAPMAKQGDWKRIASYITQSEKPNEPILIFKYHGFLPFKFYYSGVNQVAPIPLISPINNESEPFSITTPILNNQEQIFDALSSTSSNNQHFWLVTCHTLSYSIELNILEDFVSKFCSVVTNKKFYGANIRYLKISPCPLHQLTIRKKQQETRIQNPAPATQ